MLEVTLKVSHLRNSEREVRQEGEKSCKGLRNFNAPSVVVGTGDDEGVER